jgi:predicted RND superfamily exporter protein
VIPDSVIASWRNQFGPFVEFSFDKMNRDVQNQVLHDSRRALVWTAAGIVLIVYLCFRNVRVSLIVLIPIAFGIVVTFGLLLLVRHRFSFMSITAIPLIIGIGIDNGIHLVRVTWRAATRAALTGKTSASEFSRSRKLQARP